MTEAEIQEIQQRLLEATKIYGTMYGEAYPGSVGQGRIIEITSYKILKGNHGKIAIYYEWGWPGPDYNLYQISDYGITWAFSEEEIKENRKKYLKKLNSMTTLSKFKEFINPDRNTRMDEDLIRSIISDLSKKDQED